MDDKDGKEHTYKSGTDGVSIDGGKAVKGALAAESNGTLTVLDADSGKETSFRLSGAVVQSENKNGKTEPTEITGPNGKVSKFGYDDNGDLNTVNAHGIKLHRSGKQWFDDQNKPVDELRPSVKMVSSRLQTLMAASNRGIPAALISLPPADAGAACPPGDNPPSASPPSDNPPPPNPPSDNPPSNPPSDSTVGTKAVSCLELMDTPNTKERRIRILLLNNRWNT